MEQNSFDNARPNPPRRRRKRTKWQNFKEAYLPVIIVALAALMIVVFITGSVSRANEGKQTEDTTTTESTVDPNVALQQEADRLMAEAERLANMLDYEGAVAALTSFNGDMTAIEGMWEKYNEYSNAHAALVPYTDVEYVPNLSFNVLMADLDRAMADPNYGNQFNRNYVTTAEFSAILQQLYDNGYILVSVYDLAEKTVAADGTVTVSAGKLYLPEGKKPILLTQAGGNFFTYMVDGDGDGLADKSGSGFPSRLILDENGELTCEYVDAEGNTVTGSYDFITILNDFIETHPDFSYRGARATIAFTGYDGLLGYRTDAETVEKLGQEFYDSQISQVQPVLAKLKEQGYDFACYTYDMANYGEMSVSSIQSDLAMWTDEVQPILGDVDILVYPYGGDIGGEKEYSGDKYEALSSFGFRYFIGQDSSTRAWGQITENYLRQTRRNVTGALMYYSYSYYEDLFDATKIIDSARGEVPQ